MRCETPLYFTEGGYLFRQKTEMQYNIVWLFDVRDLQLKGEIYPLGGFNLLVLKPVVEKSRGGLKPQRVVPASRAVPLNKAGENVA